METIHMGIHIHNIIPTPTNSLKHFNGKKIVDGEEVVKARSPFGGYSVFPKSRLE